ncbi:hypothetical protein SeMB42_g05112 [Synchytrium endobioticum]|uniref:Uncharacterized protein n=1 Tax=Synchytrium endobioticum TaxID=286115 RepID=A0A507DDN9_9FUNG|nr:hypothetical protein SeMB42_g05112 [Synchytrium endobioticum]TPX49802.1 hypothetical protein SeLEV6574_g01275 [Synchytrium endobioticum]
MSLFGISAQIAKKHLVEIKAGKCTREGNLVTPDPRKGLLYLDQVDDLLHLCWKDRTANTVVEDLIIFPDEAELIQIAHATSGRIYVLKFKSSSQRIFFWLQEPKDDKDAETIARFNHLLNNPPAPASSAGAMGGAMNPTDLAQLLGQMSGRDGVSSRAAAHDPPSTTAVAPAAAPPGPATRGKLEELRNILANIQVPQSDADIELGDVITPELVSPLLNDASVTGALFPHLPIGAPKTTDEIHSVLRSPEFKSALRTLSYAVRSGQITPSQLGVEGGGDSPLQSVAHLLRVIQERFGNSSMSMDTD